MLIFLLNVPDKHYRIVVVSILSLSHYANMSMQYTVIFHGCTKGNFQVTQCYIFLMFAKNIDCGYTLEPPQ